MIANHHYAPTSVGRYFAASHFIEHFMAGLETAVLAIAVYSDNREPIGEKLIKSGSKGAITKAFNEITNNDRGRSISVSYIYASSLGNSKAADLLIERGINVFDNAAAVMGKPLINGAQYNVAITDRGEIRLPERFYIGAVYTGISDYSKGLTRKYAAKFVHQESNTSVTVKQEDLEQWFADGWIKAFDVNEKYVDPDQGLIDAYLKSWDTATNTINHAAATIDWGSIVDDVSADSLYRKTYNLTLECSAISAAAKNLKDAGVSLWDSRLNFLTNTPEFKAHGDATTVFRAALESIRTIAKDKRIEAGRAEVASLAADSSLHDMARAAYRKHGINVDEGSGSVIFLSKITSAISNLDAAYLHNVLSYQDNIASAEFFKLATGIKLPSSMAGRREAIDKWVASAPKATSLESMASEDALSKPSQTKRMRP